MYLYDRRVPWRIVKTFSPVELQGIRFLVILRNPVHRAFSGMFQEAPWSAADDFSRSYHREIQMLSVGHHLLKSFRWRNLYFIAFRTATLLDCRLVLRPNRLLESLAQALNSAIQSKRACTRRLPLTKTIPQQWRIVLRERYNINRLGTVLSAADKQPVMSVRGSTILRILRRKTIFMVIAELHITALSQEGCTLISYVTSSAPVRLWLLLRNRNKLETGHPIVLGIQPEQIMIITTRELHEDQVDVMKRISIWVNQSYIFKSLKARNSIRSGIHANSKAQNTGHKQAAAMTALHRFYRPFNERLVEFARLLPFAVNHTALALELDVIT